MQKLKLFWQRDLLNKLIVLAVLLIVTALVADLVFILARRSSAERLLADLFPTPTLPLQVIQTQNAATAQYESAMATASVPPTMTTMYFDITQVPPTPTSVQATPTPTPTLIGQPPSESPVAQTASPAPPAGTDSPLACLPGSPAVQGKVVEVVDGITIKVLIDGLVYTVRYLGVSLPDYESIAQTAAATTGQAVYLQEVSLLGEGVDKDLNGRLLRYVILDNQVMNLELLTQGLVILDPSAPAFSCSPEFQQAEDAARAAKVGIWAIATAP